VKVAADRITTRLVYLDDHGIAQVADEYTARALQAP
jgi:hypothetical protein